MKSLPMGIRKRGSAYVADVTVNGQRRAGSAATLEEALVLRARLAGRAVNGAPAPVAWTIERAIRAAHDVAKVLVITPSIQHLAAHWSGVVRRCPPSCSGQILASRLATDPDAYRQAGVIAKSAGLLLIFGLAVCVAPLMVTAVLAFQVHIGNGQVPIIAFLLRHEVVIVLGFWAVWILGGLVAAPAIVRGFVLGE